MRNREQLADLPQPQRQNECSRICTYIHTHTEGVSVAVVVETRRKRVCRNLGDDLPLDGTSGAPRAGGRAVVPPTDARCPEGGSGMALFPNGMFRLAAKKKKS